MLELLADIVGSLMLIALVGVAALCTFAVLFGSMLDGPEPPPVADADDVAARFRNGGML